MTRLQLKKIWCDFIQRKWRVLLTLSGLSVGFWGMASTAIALYVLNHDLSENFQQTQPPAIVLTLAPAGNNNAPLNLESLGNIEGIATLDNRPQLIGRMLVAPGKWLPMLIQVVEDFDHMKVAKVALENGLWPTQAGEIVMERDAINLMNWMRTLQQSSSSNPHEMSSSSMIAVDEVKIGHEVLNLDLGQSQSINVQLSGSVHDPALAPARTEKLLYAYTTAHIAGQWQGVKIAPRLLVQPQSAYRSQEQLNAIAKKLETALLTSGFSVQDIRFPSTTEHVHQFQMDSILFLLAVVGALALLLAGVLVVNLNNSVFISQLKQLAILKSLGATRLQLVLMQTAAFAIMGLLSSLLIMPIAISSAYAISRAVSDFLNFNILTTQPPLALLLGLIALGVSFPSLASLWTSWRWAGVSVASAMHYAPASLTAGGWQWLRFPGSTCATQGLRNALRQPQRTCLTVLTITIGTAGLVIMLNILSSLSYTAANEIQQKNYDVAVTLSTQLPWKTLSWMEKFAVVEAVESQLVVNWPIVELTEKRPFKVVDESSRLNPPQILQGKWLSAAETGIVINQRLASQLPDVRVGQDVHIDIKGKPYVLPITGIVKEFNGAAAYISEKQ